MDSEKKKRLIIAAGAGVAALALGYLIYRNTESETVYCEKTRERTLIAPDDGE